jgi:hypothetical protein
MECVGAARIKEVWSKIYLPYKSNIAGLEKFDIRLFCVTILVLGLRDNVLQCCYHHRRRAPEEEMVQM